MIKILSILLLSFILSLDVHAKGTKIHCKFISGEKVSPGKQKTIYKKGDLLDVYLEIDFDREKVIEATKALTHAAGNFYINDKPTGAVVGQQPFGGGRASGTNDKAGSMFNLLRWVSQRTIKETFVPPKDYRYPFMDKE